MIINYHPYQPSTFEECLQRHNLVLDVRELQPMSVASVRFFEVSVTTSTSLMDRIVGRFGNGSIAVGRGRTQEEAIVALQLNLSGSELYFQGRESVTFPKMRPVL